MSHEAAALHITVTRQETPDLMRLVATNGCLCSITVRASVAESNLGGVPTGSVYEVTLEPGETRTVLQAPAATPHESCDTTGQPCSAHPTRCISRRARTAHPLRSVQASWCRRLSRRT